MKKILALTLSLVMFITSVGFGATTTTGTTFKGLSDVYGIWMASKTTGYMIDKSGTSLIIRDKGTAKLTYVANTAKNKMPVLAKDKKSVNFDFASKKYTSRKVSFKKDTKGAIYLVEDGVNSTTAKGMKFFANKAKFEEFVKSDIGDMPEGGSYPWLKVGTDDYDLKENEELMNALSAYGPTKDETSNWKIAVGGNNIQYAKDGLENMTDSEYMVTIQDKTINIFFLSQISDTELAITADILASLYPASAKIDDVSNRIIKDINATKTKDNFGDIVYSIVKLNGKTFTMNGIKVAYDKSESYLQIIINK